MSESELYMQDPNESFDLPRWQTQVDPLSSSSSAQAAHGAQASYLYSAPPPPPPHALTPSSPQRIQSIHQNPSAQTRQPRISQLLEQEHALAPPSSQYSQPTLSRSTSLGGAQANNIASRLRRPPQPDDIEAYSADSHSMAAPRQQPQLSGNSFYAPSGGYQGQSIQSTASTTSPPDSYSDMYYNGSSGHPPKRLQDPNVAATRNARSPHRGATSSTPNLLDPYAQQSQYSPTGPAYPYGNAPPLDQRTTSAAYQTHSRNNSQLKAEPSTPPIPPNYGSQNQAHHVASYSPSHSKGPSSPYHPALQVASHHTGGPNIKASISQPSTPMSYIPSTTPGSHYYPQDQSMIVDSPKRRPVGFRRVRTAHDMQPRLDVLPGTRRMGPDGSYLSVSAPWNCCFADTPDPRVHSLYGNLRRISSTPTVSAIRNSAMNRRITRDGSSRNRANRSITMGTTMRTMITSCMSTIGWGRRKGTSEWNLCRRIAIASLPSGT